mgnify:CR=1 FL=1
MERLQTVEKKILPWYFDAVVSGRKNFELRRDSDDFVVGNVLVLREWDGLGYTGRSVSRTITYVLRDVPEYGLEDGFVILGISPTS